MCILGIHWLLPCPCGLLFPFWSSGVKARKSKLGSQSSEVKAQKSKLGSQISEVKARKSKLGSQSAEVKVRLAGRYPGRVHHKSK